MKVNVSQAVEAIDKAIILAEQKIAILKRMRELISQMAEKE